MIARRPLLLGIVAVAVSPAAARGDPARALLDRAMAAAGGRAALARVGTLKWTGTAQIFAGERTIDIGVSTTVVPFVSARSDSWLLSEGPAKTRSLIIGGDQGWIERNAGREPMPAPMAAHERAQYALYGLMLLVPLLDMGAHVETLPGRCLRAVHPGAPTTDLCFDSNGRLVGARNEVGDPQGGAPIAQHFSFQGTLVSNGVRWPRTIRIEQNGRPYFELRLTTFEAVSHQTNPSVIPANAGTHS